jgi:hypothetical protein
MNFYRQIEALLLKFLVESVEEVEVVFTGPKAWDFYIDSAFEQSINFQRQPECQKVSRIQLLWSIMPIFIKSLEVSRGVVISDR